MIDDPNTPDSGSGLDVGLNRPVKFKKAKKNLSDERRNCLALLYCRSSQTMANGPNSANCQFCK